MRIYSYLLVTALGVVGPANARSEPIVIVDSWWSGDYAKGGCEQAKSFMKQNKSIIKQVGCEAVTACPDVMPRYTACMVSDPSAAARSFEDELMTQFAVNRDCKGATFARFYGPPANASEALLAAMNDKSHQTLIIDFTVGEAAQPWTMGDSKGEGTTAKIAADVCAIIMGKGGTLVR
jgi:hypothetical protein